MNIKISLAAARVNAHKTQEDTAKFMHTSKNTVVAWEKGTAEPSVGQARELSDFYKMPMDCIIFLPKKSNKI